MNTHIAQNSQRAAKLKSLSLQPPVSEPEPQKRVAPRVAILGIAICLMAGATGFYLKGDSEISSTPLAKPGSETDAQAPAIMGRPAPVAVLRGITGSGHVVAPDHAAVFSQYEGRITAVLVGIGDRVEAGQVLIRLDDANARFRAQSAKAAEQSAFLTIQVRLIDSEEADAVLLRMQTLALGNVASRQDLEKAQRAQERAVNGEAQARQIFARAGIDLAQANEALAALEIRAPITGTVTELKARIGESVLSRADADYQSGALLTITDTSNLVIDVDIAETGLAQVVPGLRGEAVFDAFPDQPFAIEVSRIAPAALLEKATIGLRLSLISPPDGIRPNMAARVNIASSPTKETAIPEQTGSIK
jgi:RND family efflux transporter MFP subunit